MQTGVDDYFYILYTMLDRLACAQWSHMGEVAVLEIGGTHTNTNTNIVCSCGDIEKKTGKREKLRATTIVAKLARGERKIRCIKIK